MGNGMTHVLAGAGPGRGPVLWLCAAVLLALSLPQSARPSRNADGNMLSCGGWAYSWNGEDRLASATRGTTRLEFRYDYMGRRFEKKAYESNTLTRHQLFAYDGFKQIAEYDALANNALASTYLWQPVGLDVPLLRNGNEFYVSDANKNVIALIDANGTVTDTYLYDPFGNCTHTGGSTNPFRFSSEHFDGETGLVYYNYRYYSPKMGRWIKRDQLEELAGYNLCVCVNNNLVMYYDSLGLSSTPLSNGTVIDLTSGLETFFYALEMNFDQLKKNKCTFIIAADKDDINRFLPSRYTPSKVSQRIEKRLKEKFTMKCLTIMKISHSSDALIHALKNNPCICGIIYIGHASITPSRLIFTEKDSIAVLPRNYYNTPGRKSYKALPTSNILPGNVSALFGCRTAKGGIISISARLSQLFNGTVVGATGKINFDGGDPYSPEKALFEIFSAPSNNYSIPPECCCKGEK